VKRGNGQGSVYRHGRAWEAVGYIDGRRRVFRATTSREARERLENATRSAKRGERLRHRLACASAVRRLNRQSLAERCTSDAISVDIEHEDALGSLSR
jgi:predicted aminopeptidase